MAILKEERIGNQRLILGDCLAVMPTLGRFDAVVTDPPYGIWGGNYFTDFLPPSMRWLVWDKMQGDFSLADCEFAWTSQNAAARIFRYSRGAAIQDGKHHPTQKPLALMEWSLKFLDDRLAVMDPFMGSGTTLVACQRMGRAGTGIELDPDYFAIACRRVDEAARQPDLLIPETRQAPTQEAMDL